MSFYKKLIVEILKNLGRPEVDPRHIEGFMRVEHPTLDHLDRAAFGRLVKRSLKAVDEAPPDLLEYLAR